MTPSESPRYKAFAAAPKQKKILSNRRATVRRTTPALPPKTESQASFTQQYPHWLTAIEHQPSRIQGTETDDDEYEEPRPKKRRKKSERERGQATYTQMTKAILGREPTPKVAVRADGWQVPDSSIIGSDGSGHEDVGRMEAIKQRQRARNAGGIHCTDWTPLNDDSGYETRIDGTGELYQPDSASPFQPFVQSTPPTAIKLQTPRRQRFSKDTVIPSSQSPASGKLLSTQKSQRFRNLERSPLKERTVNVPSPSNRTRELQKRKAEGSPLKMTDAKIKQGSQRISPVRFKLAPRLLANTGEAEAQKSALALGRGDAGGQKAQDEKMLADQDDRSNTRPSRELKRTKTVQDSQYEDLDLSDAEFDFPGDYGGERLDGTCQESCRGDTFHDEDFGEETQFSNRDDIQLTYDPAWSALDRDAARFCQPPTQMQTQIKLEPHVSNSTTTIEDLERESLGGGINDEAGRRPSQELGSDDLQGIQNEEREEDRDLEANEQPRVDAVPPRSQTRVLRKYVSNSTCADDDEDGDLEEDLDGFPDRSQELGSSDFDDGVKVLSSQQEEKRKSPGPPAFAAKSRPQDPLGALSESTKQHRPPISDEDNENRIPSSPPLRPSQVSTVAGTQISPSRHKDTQRPPPLTVASPRTRPQPDLIPSSSKPSSPTAPASPNSKQPFSQWPETFPSSPLPLPPWSSPPRPHETQASKARSQTQLRGARGSIGLGSLADFSLPPPPPMSSSSRPGTQACGRSSPAAE
ncbi:hypothetical protein KC356_g4401 [Hortaea werneckii]|nr:hypothetical protein KC356_g4401 [Hortaea werneckii]